MIGPVAIVDFFSPVGRRVAFQVADEAVSLHILHLYSGKFCQRRCEIDIQYQIVQTFSCGYLLRITDNERHTSRFFIKHPFVEEAVFA